MSQASVGKAMGTSQSKIARIESAEENITRDTLERLVRSLGGRVFLSISPSELNVPKPLPWWVALNEEAEPWAVVAVALRHTRTSDQAVIALERTHAETSVDDVIVGQTNI